jgi:phosphoribosylanthranilate isomerase
MPRTRIKICGITTPADAGKAAASWADAVGFVLTGGLRRSVSLDTGCEIIAALPAFVTPVGVFRDTPIDQVRAAASALNLRHVQLHGQYTPKDFAALRPLRLIKSITVDAAITSTLSQLRSAIIEHKLDHVAAILFDSAGNGGTGIENDWAAIRRTLDAIGRQSVPPIIVAGGLTPINVAQVIRQLRPWAVDVSSGVESASSAADTAPAKSAQAIRDFIEAISIADSDRAPN